jgi:HlyD family secretion protein
VLAYIDEARSGTIREGQPAEVRLRSLPHEVFPARVVRVGIESDRVTEERRVYVKCERCPVRFHLGEQAEVLITVATLAKVRLVPEAVVTGYDGAKGRVWSVEDGRLKRRVVSFGHRTDDSRLEITESLPPGIEIVTQVDTSLSEGRTARAIREVQR